MERDSSDSGLPLSANFDGLSLTGAKIFTNQIYLENYTNFEEKKFSFDSLHTSDDDFSEVLNFVCMN